MSKTQDYWNDRYATGGNSGYGSYGEQADLKLSIMKKYIKNVTSITDIGCGDFAFGKRVCEQFPKAKYQGYDISDVVVEENKSKYPGVFFATNPSEYPSADLVLCIDVLFHFSSPEENEEMLQKLEKSWTKYLVVSAANKKNNVSRFGEPIAKVLLEQEDDTSYLYIWKK